MVHSYLEMASPTFSLTDILIRGRQTNSQVIVSGVPSRREKKVGTPDRRLLILFFHDPTMLRALGGKLSEENQYGGKRGGFASYHKLKIVQRCVKIREGDAEINL